MTFQRLPLARAARPVDGTWDVAFLLLEGFTHLAFAGALEPLRLAGEVAGRPLYRWRVLSADGGPVACSNGTPVLTERAAGPFEAGTRLVVVGGLSGAEPSPRVLSLLRGARAHGAEVMGLCGGVAALARADLLAGEDCAVHWQLRDAIAERFPDLRPSSRAFVAGRVPMAAGGAAAADLMLHLLAEEQGPDLAAAVADLIVLSGPRGPDANQTMSVQARLGVRNAQLAQALRLMEETVEAPLDMSALAARVGLSVRQVERLFARHLGTSPNRQYVGLRLERARRLLVQSDLSVAEVALACGFDSPAHFGRRYRQRFGVPACRTRAMTRPLLAGGALSC